MSCMICVQPAQLVYFLANLGFCTGRALLLIIFVACLSTRFMEQLVNAAVESRLGPTLNDIEVMGRRVTAITALHILHENEITVSIKRLPVPFICAKSLRTLAGRSMARKNAP